MRWESASGELKKSRSDSSGSHLETVVR